MALRVFSRGAPAERHERDQIEALLPLLDRAFKDDQDGCTALINLSLPIDQPNQIDLIVIRRNALVILDLKDFRGRILADCGPGGRWTVETDRKPTWTAERENPFDQAERHRKQLSYYLLTQVLDQTVLESFPSKSNGRPSTAGYWVASGIRSWVVVQPGAKVFPANLDAGADPWFRITRLDEVSRELSMEQSPRMLLSSEGIERMALSLGAQVRPNWRDWYLVPPSEGETEHTDTIRFRAITNSLASPDTNEVQRGIRDVARLGLRSYLAELVALADSGCAALEIEALRVLHAWGSQLPSVKEVEWLTAKDNARRSWAWARVEVTKNPAAAPLLRSLVASGDGDMRRKALSLLISLEASGTPEFLLDLARARGIPESSSDPETWELLVRGLGRQGFAEAIPLLQEMIDACVVRLSKEWDNFQSALVDECVRAFAGIGDPTAVRTLTRLLGSEEGEWDSVIINALGRLGNPSLVAEILPYLESRSDRVLEQAILALRRLGGPAAFDALWCRFLVEVRGGKRTYELTEALGQIDPREFEDRILALLGEGKEGIGASGSLLWSLSRFATARSGSVVLRYTSNRDTYMDACNVLLMPEVFPTVAERARAMHDAPSEVERASHVCLSVQNGTSMELQGLEPHEMDSSPMVRMNVVQIYGAFRSEYTTHRLDVMVNDPDPLLRRHVALALLGHAEHWLNFCDVVAESRVMRHAEAISRPVGIVAVQQSEEGESDPSPILVAKETIVEVRPLKIPKLGSAVGVTYRLNGALGRMVIVPREITPFMQAEEVKDWVMGLATQGYSEVIKFEPLDPPSPEYVAAASSLFTARNRG